MCHVGLQDNLINNAFNNDRLRVVSPEVCFRRTERCVGHQHHRLVGHRVVPCDRNDIAVHLVHENLRESFKPELRVYFVESPLGGADARLQVHLRDVFDFAVGPLGVLSRFVHDVHVVRDELVVAAGAAAGAARHGHQGRRREQVEDGALVDGAGIVVGQVQEERVGDGRHQGPGDGLQERAHGLAAVAVHEPAQFVRIPCRHGLCRNRESA